MTEYLPQFANLFILVNGTEKQKQRQIFATGCIEQAYLEHHIPDMKKEFSLHLDIEMRESFIDLIHRVFREPLKRHQTYDLQYKSENAQPLTKFQGC